MSSRRLLLLLLPLYVLIVLVVSEGGLQGDEGYYLQFATNLSRGYYSSPGEVDLWFGPGYPMVLLPFVLLNLPLLAVKLLNCLLLWGAVLLFYRALSRLMSERSAVMFSLLLGVYPPFLRHLHLLYTETLVVFLVCGFLFCFLGLFRFEGMQWPRIVSSSLFLAYLVLTKVFFAYVIPVALVLSLCFFLVRRGKATRKTLAVYGISLALCMPYLLYTGALTGKVFYWSNAGGLQLYWMSSPFPEDLGDWHAPEDVQSNPELARNHGEFFDEISTLSSIERDGELKRRAVRHIASSPAKYLRNVAANLGRLFFNYPFSYTPQKMSTYLYVGPNLFLVALLGFCLYPSFVGRRVIPEEIWSVMLFSLISLGGLSLLSAFCRQLIPLVPIFVLWIAFILTNVVGLEVRRGPRLAERAVSGPRR